MRLSAMCAGLFLIAIFFAVDSPQIKAQTKSGDTDIAVAALNTNLQIPEGMVVEQPMEALPESPPSPIQIEHVVADNETLSSIAARYNTTWLRLYAKNTTIEKPDVIKVGDKLIIPFADEVLAERALPPPPPPVAANPPSSPVRAGQTAAGTSPKGASSGNTYSRGYCTYYAKQRRPDLPNNLGNADTWVARARAQGIPTGSQPRAGAIGQQGMHVVYVERVNEDGTVFISEMNYVGFNTVSNRTASAGSFQYIY